MGCDGTLAVLPQRWPELVQGVLPPPCDAPAETPSSPRVAELVHGVPAVAGETERACARPQVGWAGRSRYRCMGFLFTVMAGLPGSRVRQAGKQDHGTAHRCTPMDATHGMVVGNSPDRNVRSQRPDKNLRDPRGFPGLAIQTARGPPLLRSLPGSAASISAVNGRAGFGSICVHRRASAVPNSCFPACRAVPAWSAPCVRSGAVARRYLRPPRLSRTASSRRLALSC